MNHRNNSNNFLLVTGIYRDEMERILAAALKLQSLEDQKIKKGCFMAVCDSQTGKIVVQQFGQIASMEERNQAERSAIENSLRLLEVHKEIRSFESGNKGQPGGVHCHLSNLIVACGGLGAKLNEAVSATYVSFCVAVASKALPGAYKDKPGLYKEISDSLHDVEAHFTDNEFIGPMNNSLYALAA